MARLVKVLALLAALAPAPFVAACVSQSQAMVERYSQRIDPLMNRGTKDDVARDFGVPTGKQLVGKSEIWEYMKETGTVADASPGMRRMGGGPVYGQRTYEKLTLEFDEHAILRAWRLESEDGLLHRDPPAAGDAPSGK
jgi:hypothetical protein